MSRVYEEAAPKKCDYCNGVIIYQQAYPCSRPAHCKDEDRDYFICESCLAEEFCNGEEENQKEYFGA